MSDDGFALLVFLGFVVVLAVLLTLILPRSGSRGRPRGGYGKSSDSTWTSSTTTTYYGGGDSSTSSDSCSGGDSGGGCGGGD